MISTLRGGFSIAKSCYSCAPDNTEVSPKGRTTQVSHDVQLRPHTQGGVFCRYINVKVDENLLAGRSGRTCVRVRTDIES